MTRPSRTPALRYRTLDDVVAAVRTNGGRLSVPRRLVLEALFAAEDPVSAETIADRLGLELTSVYRNLEHLEALGVVRHLHLGHGPGLYALRGSGAREHLVCETCDRVETVEPARLDAVRAAIREQFGFEAAFDHFPILGICAACSARGPAAALEHATQADPPHVHDARGHVGARRLGMVEPPLGQ